MEPSTRPEPLAVSQLVAAVSNRMEAEFADVEVEGEVSNLRIPGSGHAYFTLKDDSAQLRAVAWRSTVARLPFRPEDGQLVRARGGVTVYPPRGDLQLVVRTMRLAGEGALQRAFEALRRRLAAEGLFDPARKRRLPPYPDRIGIVTSSTGAALQDMLTVIARRYPLPRIVLASVRVQGEGAAAEIARAVRAFNDLDPDDSRRPDLLIVGRGGGSLEDLWAFNEESLARVLHASGIPVVSAVGHETDVTICDLVADVRAATPSMAGELVVPDGRELLAALRGTERRLGSALSVRLRQDRDRLKRLEQMAVLGLPERRLRVAMQQLDEAAMRLRRGMDGHRRAARERHRAMVDRLRALDPMRPVKSGFALVSKGERPVPSVRLLQPGDTVTVRFVDGSADMKVETTRQYAPRDTSET